MLSDNSYYWECAPLYVFSTEAALLREVFAVSPVAFAVEFFAVFATKAVQGRVSYLL